MSNKAAGAHVREATMSHLLRLVDLGSTGLTCAKDSFSGLVSRVTALVWFEICPECPVNAVYRVGTRVRADFW